MTAISNTSFNIYIEPINTLDLFTQLHSAISETATNRKEEIIKFIKNNPLGRVLITGLAGVGKSYLLERVVDGLNEQGVNLSRTYSSFSYNETIYEDINRNKTIIIDGLDEFKGKDRAEVEHLILLGVSCIVTMRSRVVSGQIDAEYQNFASRFDLVINLDDDFSKHEFGIHERGDIWETVPLLNTTEILYKVLQSINHTGISDKTSLQLLENTIQEYDRPGDIRLIEPGIVLPSKEILVPSKEIINDFSVLKESIIDKAYKNPGLVDSMSPRQFEEFIADIYERLGYKVELTKMTRDGGKDIVLYTNGPTGHNMYYVECKKYNKNNKVDVGVVRNFYGVVEAGSATAGILVTSSSYTKDAKDFEKQVYRRLTLLDYLELLKAVIVK